MSDFDNNWGNDNSWNSNENNSYHNDQESQESNDFLADLSENEEHSSNAEDFLKDLSHDDTEEDNSAEDYSSKDYYDNAEESQESKEDKEDDLDKEDNLDNKFSIEKIKKKTVNIPTKASKDHIFSERDIYKVNNIVIILNECPDSIIGCLDNILSISTRDNLKRAVAIATMEKDEFKDAVSTVETIIEIHDSSIVKEGENQFKKATAVISMVDGLEAKQKGDMLSALRKILKSNNIKRRISATRSSSGGDIVMEIVDATKEDPVVEKEIIVLKDVIELLKSYNI